jgi:hypothetical protein
MKVRFETIAIQLERRCAGAKTMLQIVIQIDVQIERISRMRYGFFLFFARNKALGLKKSVPRP